ncbi:phytanoyl-CoA dioxygenase family protein [aff. Roholtiella sp. LEGE 12411]|uniref:phytanoyl-CoA dioxygenase family protein n=1 Tax=aff. Roholtiella sp. LEGE 12411 TaxID=1828822 RepID=UPI00187EF8D7|nr:phytanoyl-CoA dioxygenase family protein [aff. Roholtiella sp. LEGE 12411]MBE9033951.1 phytanoyl-CoA dioxygenase family protein [aff. Roholtiella sp. LEGE 12411]
MAEDTILRKSISLEDLTPLLTQAQDINYWRSLNPNLTISDNPFADFQDSSDISKKRLNDYTLQLREEGYFQTNQLIPSATIQEMNECINQVRKAGFPPIFALVYDVFYQVFDYFNPILEGVLGSGYKLIPNFWVYYIDTVDTGKGFEPHRDAEYTNTIDANGMPTVLTIWITITDANPLNSCMYILPLNRDPQYAEAITDLSTPANQFALEDVRALPTKAGVLSCWNQYVFHWGSRSSKRAEEPRISYAAYCQKGESLPIDDVMINIPSSIDFKTRLGLIARGLYRYSYASFEESKEAEPVLHFLKQQMANLEKGVAIGIKQ